MKPITLLQSTPRLAFGLALGALLTLSAEPSFAAPPGRGGGGGGGGRGGGPGLAGDYKSQITPHWFHDNTCFWYRNDLKGGAKEFIFVDAEQGVRRPAFDHAKLAAAIGKATGQDVSADKLPFSDIEFVDKDAAIQFAAGGKTWKCDLKSYACTEVKNASAALTLPATDALALANEAVDSNLELADTDLDGSELSSNADADDDAMPSPLGGRRGGGGGRGGAGGGGGGRGFGGAREANSPDEKWTAFIKDNNVFLKPRAGGDEIQFTTDGVSNNYYGSLSWAPDSLAFIAWKTEPGNSGPVYRLQSSPATNDTIGGRALLLQANYPQAGDTFTRYELNIFQVEGHKQIKPEVDRIDFRGANVSWNKDNYHFTYTKEDRGHTRWRLIEGDSHTGKLRNIIDEKADTFIWTDNMDGVPGLTHIRYLDNTPEAIYESEQTGWRHLYLVDLKPGGKSGLTPITKGEWVVRGISQVDEDKRQIWFQASSVYPNQNPFALQYGRVNFDGTGLVFLTDGDGEHSVTYSPDKKYLIDTYSQLDKPRKHELRRVSDGRLVCKLDDEDISEAVGKGWKPPLELFVAKGRDGKTDIYGYIERPAAGIDPAKKYPILEDIYAGPQGSPGTLIPTTFSTAPGRHGQYTADGLIVVKIDGMGMPGRSKAFHDVCWKNLADAGFPDRIAWMKAAAAKYPYMDLDHVGIYGTSAGGQNAAGALLFHPEFYKVAVANCGCHDNRIDKSSWNEQWMGYCPPEKIWTKDDDNWYSKSSNIDNAYRLKGRFFLIVGELDSNVPPESSFRFANELIRANKYFDFLVVPGANHGASSPVNGRYTAQRTHDFLVQNLLHPELRPNPNETN